MDNQRAVPHFALGVLTVLSLGAIVLSLHLAPANAGQQLTTAAKNTVSVGSFVLTDTVTAVNAKSAGGGTHHEVVDIVYRAPDQVREAVSASGQTETLLALGMSRYIRRGNGPWQALSPTDVNAPVGQQAAQGVLQPLVDLTPATSVVRHGDRYSFEPTARSLILTELFGASGASLPPSASTFEATVSGEFLKEVDIRVHTPGGQVMVKFALRSFDTAPALVAPVQPGR